jgi:hypothetical protein
MIEDPQRIMPGTAGIEGLQLLESCGFAWIFDCTSRHFRRIPRAARVGYDAWSAWTTYHRLEIDETRGCFLVVLDDAGGRALRAWLHADPCRRCSPEWETLTDSRHSIRWWKEELRVVERRSTRSGRHPLRPLGGWVRSQKAS